jgi:hypothetical protein
MEYEALIRELEKLDRADMVEVFYRAFGAMETRYPDRRNFVYRKLVVAEVSWEDEGTSADINIVCPSGSFSLGGGSISEVGKCDGCGSNLCSAFKRVNCPVCLSVNGLS